MTSTHTNRLPDPEANPLCDEALTLAEAFRLGEILVHVRRYGDGGEGGNQVRFATQPEALKTLADEHGFSGLDLEDMADAVNVARLMLGYLEGRDTLVELALRMQKFGRHIDTLYSAEQMD
jgi:hypothetical protein